MYQRKQVVLQSGDSAVDTGMSHELDVRGSIQGSKDNLPFPDRLWDPPRLLHVYRGLFTQG
jgi:hypothetical protein